MCKIYIQKYVGNEIKNLRKSNNLTTRELANVIGISQQQISRYEIGENKIYIAIIYVLSIYFDYSLESFFPENSKLYGSESPYYENKIINSIYG